MWIKVNTHASKQGLTVGLPCDGSTQAHSGPLKRTLLDLVLVDLLGLEAASGSPGCGLLTCMEH
jgi:hypothetical protein